MKRVLLVVGTPGVGKSAVSALLAARLEAVRIDLGGLVKDEGLSCGFDRQRETLVADTDKVSRRVADILRETEGCVVVDGHFAMNVVAAADAFLTFVLRRNPDELRKILRERGYLESKVTENLAAEVLDVCLFDAVEAYGEDKVCEIDATGRKFSEVVEEMVDVVEGRKHRRVGVVNWLMKLELENRLDEFLGSL